ncbi:MAG: hypothetical protein KA184_13120 [Candidatus Hydrogenedentes bacterium]|nr:hypothetical protein [Candidatus Hydrogenedentota bacterium]
MTPNIVAIGRAALELGVGLTGVRVERIDQVRDMESRLDELLDSEARVVLVDETFRDQFSEWCSNRLARHKGQPLVIYCPPFDEDDAHTDAYISAILRPAVGFEIRLD